MGLPAASTAGTALVTGASSGIGVAIARELAAKGHALILVARREERLRSLATELTDQHGIAAEAIACDLALPEERARLVDQVNQGGRVVEVLVNNAGFGSRGRFVSNDPDRMVGMVRLNIEAVVDLTGRFLPGMVERGRGSVINISSTSAFQPLPGAAVYAAGKSFVLSFSEAIRTELRGTGVGVTAVCPGPVKTEFTDAAGMHGIEDSTPDAIWMTAEEIGEAAVEGAAADKRVVVPGALNRAGSLLGQHTPRFIGLPIFERIWGLGLVEGLDRGLMAALEVRGVELDWSERGEGSPVLLVHETGVDRAAWDGVAQALAGHGVRAIGYDRRGWGASGEPPGYARTTIEEQSEDAVVLLEGIGAQGAVLAGAGLGAIVALDLAARRPDLVAGTVLVEPPLLSLLPEATELLAADRRALEAAAGEGRDALVDLYLSGGLGALATGAERIPEELTAPARERPASLIAEIGSVPAWTMSVPRLAGATRPAIVLTSAGTPRLLVAAAAALAARLDNAEHRELPGDAAGPAHLDAAADVAEAALEIAEEGSAG